MDVSLAADSTVRISSKYLAADSPFAFLGRMVVATGKEGYGLARSCL